VKTIAAIRFVWWSSLDSGEPMHLTGPVSTIMILTSAFAAHGALALRTG